MAGKWDVFSCGMLRYAQHSTNYQHTPYFGTTRKILLVGPSLLSVSR